MPPKGDGERAWLEGVADRLDAYGQCFDALVAAQEDAELEAAEGVRAALARGAGGESPPPAAGTAAASSSPYPRGSASSTVGLPGLAVPQSLPRDPVAERAALRFARTAALDFAPSRRAVVIAGRPVVALRRLSGRGPLATMPPAPLSFRPRCAPPADPLPRSGPGRPAHSTLLAGSGREARALRPQPWPSRASPASARR